MSEYSDEEIISLIAAEFRSDPMSVACFDMRLVNAVVNRAEEIDSE